jgi:hypothetical protein
MSAGLLLVRTKLTAADDPDPTLGVFTPPEKEVFKPSSLAKGFRLGLVQNGGPFTVAVNIFARDSTTKTWFRAGVSSGTNRTLLIQDDVGPHDLWVGLTTILGGTPTEIWMEEVV